MAGKFLSRGLQGISGRMLLLMMLPLVLAVALPALGGSPAASSGPPAAYTTLVDIVGLLPPPPAADSPAQQADLQAVLEAQRAAHADGTVAHAVADVEQSCGRFSDALGDDLTSTR